MRSTTRRAVVLVAFASLVATLGVLLPGGAPASAATYVTDTVRVSVADGGGQSTGEIWNGRSDVSGDGRFVIFSSDDPNLVPGDTNGSNDVFVHEVATGHTVRVSLATDGTQGSFSTDFAISGDGRYVAFNSSVALIPGAPNFSELYVRDRDTDNDGRYDEPDAVSTALLSRRAVAGQLSPLVVSNKEAGADRLDMSADGRFVTFPAAGDNLVPGVPPGGLQVDIYVADRDTDVDGTYDEPGATSTDIVSVDPGGNVVNDDNTDARSPQISDDGRFVTFQSNRLLAGPGPAG